MPAKKLIDGIYICRCRLWTDTDHWLIGLCRKNKYYLIWWKDVENVKREIDGWIDRENMSLNWNSSNIFRLYQFAQKVKATMKKPSKCCLWLSSKQKWHKTERNVILGIREISRQNGKEKWSFSDRLEAINNRRRLFIKLLISHLPMSRILSPLNSLHRLDWCAKKKCFNECDGKWARKYVKLDEMVRNWWRSSQNEWMLSSAVCMQFSPYDS